jgi:hypothetical protein
MDVLLIIGNKTQRLMLPPKTDGNVLQRHRNKSENYAFGWSLSQVAC